ncbi:hypothetical protein FRC09_002533 [Ceratobasidium sp. 395]|nr:hypothetical protein FRC09_002533 [Ceratobasidium sp. 395]
MLQQPVAFMSLPEELIVRILQLGNLQDILRFSALQIELKANRLQLSSGFSHVESQGLLESLKRYRDNWLDLALHPDQTITRAFEWRRGIYSQPTPHDGVLLTQCSETGSTAEPGHIIHVVPLDDPESQWKVKCDVEFYSFVVDPGQQLLVLLTVDQTNPRLLSLHFHSLMTGLVHPLASKSMITLQIGFRIGTPSGCDASLWVTEDLLVLELLGTESDSLSDVVYDVLIINWRLGALLHHTGNRQGGCTTAYLGRDQLAMFTAITAANSQAPGASSLELLIFNCIRTTVFEGLSLDELQYDVSSYVPLVPAYSLEFPTLMDGLFFVPSTIEVYSGSVSSDFSPKRSKFRPDPSYGTLCLDLELVGRFQDNSFIVFLDAQRIRDYVENISPYTTQLIPWDHWGENATRWIRRHNTFGSQSNMHGSRFVMLYQHARAEPVPYHFIADFNPLVVKRYRNRQSDSNRLRAVGIDDHTFREGIWPHKFKHGFMEQEIAVINVGEDMPTVIADIGKEPIYSRLPYRLNLVGDLLVHYDNWIIDGNRLIGTKRDYAGEIERLVAHYIPE